MTLTGTASIEDDQARRQRFWREQFADFWPSGPEDDGYVLIKFVPARIELMNIAQGVAPEPFGLRPVILARTGPEWVVIENEDEPS